MTDRDAAAIWRQTTAPVVYRQGRDNPLMVKLPFRPDNRAWIRGGRQRKPTWNPRYECWETPKAWFEELVRQALARFGRVYVIQPYKEKEVCAPACWNAGGIECECSCMGENHGSEAPFGRWHIVSDTFAVRWRERKLACRLIAKPIR